MKKLYTTLAGIFLISSTIFAQTLVAYYPFNGNANDAMGTANGTVNGATLTTDRFGNANSAYSFDGVSNYILGDASSFPVGDRTISLWFDAATGSIANHPGLFGYGGGVCGTSFIMGINNMETPLEYQTQSQCNDDLNQYAYPDVPENNWYNWVITVSGTTSKIYINGVLESTATTFTNPTTVAGTNFIIGNIVNTNGLGSYGVEAGNISYFQGSLDDIKIYSGALSPQQIFDAYLNDMKKPGSGNALLFDNTLTQIVDVGNGFDQAGSFSFETWVKRTNTDITDANAQTFMASQLNNGWSIGINQSSPANRIYFSKVGISQVVSASSITDTNWHHVAVTYDATSNQVVFYIDGVADAPLSYSPGGFNSGNTNYRLGGRNNGVNLDNNLNGMLDEVRVWSGVVLTQEEIRDWMCKKINSSHPEYTYLKGYFQLDEGSGLQTGGYNGIYGTLINGPTWETSGASIGDTSAYDYTNVIKTVMLGAPTGETFTVTSTSGNPAGIQVYRVDTLPNTLTGTTGTGINHKYFGVFQSGGTTPLYSAVYNYGGNATISSNDPTGFRLYRRSNNADNSWIDAMATLNTTAKTLTVSDSNTEYILGDIAGALPVNLISFNAVKNGSDVVLNWQTTNEENLKNYVVEKSTDAISFTQLIVVNANNNTGINNYTATDMNPANGINYYRLKQIDEDGNFTLSNIIKVTFISNGVITFMPNPAKSFITISSPTVVKQIRLLSVGGQIIKTWENVSPNAQLDLGAIASGTYMLEFINDQSLQTMKLVKE